MLMFSKSVIENSSTIRVIDKDDCSIFYSYNTTQF